MSKFRFIPVFLLFFADSSFAQENNIWYFGRKAGLNFSSGSPVALHNSAMDADEGCSSICDSTGKILFYTNGVTVYNRNHQQMLNGNGLAGNISSVQSAVIVPFPGNNRIYYIFTSDALENNYANGYNYSVVDMSLDNGLGQVVSKNILLNSSGTERLIAARHADGSSVWLITNDNSSNIFRAWLVDCNGLSTSPVISTAGNILNAHGLMNTGMMKVSPDGKLLCQTHFPDIDISNPNYAQLFDFDNMTGIVSNARIINIPGNRIFGCDFSPNSRLLYLSSPSDKKIDQVDAKLLTASAIIASRYTINTGLRGFYGIQLAPDQKIYLSYPSNFLSVITSPDIKGAGCNFQKDFLDISQNISGQAYAGLPSYINDLSFDGGNNFNYAIMDSCSGTVRFNGFTTIAGTVNWNWDFGDGFTSSLQNPIHSFSAIQQSYKVKLIIQSANGCSIPLIRRKEVIPKGLKLVSGFNSVAVCDSGYIKFTNTSLFEPDSALIQYNWDFGDGNISSLKDPVHSYSPGNYNVTLRVKTTTACLDQIITKPVAMQSLSIQASPDVEINLGETTQLNVSGGGLQFTWSPRTGLSDFSIPNPLAKPKKSTLYFITATNAEGCKSIDSVLVKIKPIQGVRVPTGFTPNNDGKNDVLRAYISDDYILHEFSIYNRWGQKIYTSTDRESGWNGKVNGVVQDAAVYIWLISVTNTTTGKKEDFKGSFVIIR